MIPDTPLDLHGTYRARRATDTWQSIEPLLSEYGVTRVADVTGFDCIGIPVVMATRPTSETLVVSQGKGPSYDLARVSAVMECIELAHSEYPQLPAATAHADDLGLTYPISALQLRATPELAGRLSLDWYPATTLLSDTSTWIPRGLVDLRFGDGYDWRPAVFRTSSTGLASGNTIAEAQLHALYEIIERDVVSTLSATDHDHRQIVDVDTIDSDHCQVLFNLLRAAEVSFEVAMVPNRFGIPTAVSFVWSTDFAITCAGSGSHRDPAVAVSRAVTEAVQSRLTEIVGTRDDIESDLSPDTNLAAPTPALRTTGTPWPQTLTGHGFPTTTLAQEVVTVAERITEQTGHEPIWIDLSTRPDTFSVVRVFAPGLAYRARGYVPR